jgi:Na+/H+-dicarboxylate symporter
MKVWVKLLIGSFLGFSLGFLLPDTNPGVLSVFTYLRNLSIGIGRYAAAPLIVFSLTIGIYELRQDGKFWNLIFKTFLIIIGISFFVIALGIGAIQLFSPQRIPVLIEQEAEVISFIPQQNLLDIFPSNMLSVLSDSGVYIFPLCVFAFFLAFGLSYDRNYTKPVISLFDSLSRIFFHIASFFSEILGLLIIVLSAFWAVKYKAILNSEIFNSLIRMLLLFSVILALIVLPALLFLIKRRRQNPWKILYGCLGPAVSAFFSGDYNFNIPVLMMHLKGNLGIKRRSSSISVVLFSTFGRAGSATVACIAFIAIVQSYSSLSIPPLDILKIGLTAFVVSFLLARNSSDAAFTALAVLCMRYGHGFETGYLILKPISFYLISVGVFLDIIITAFGSFAVAELNGFLAERNIRKFI